MKFYTHAAARGNFIYVRGFENGERFQRKVSYEPYLFTSTKKETPFTTIYGEPVEKKSFNNIREAKDFIERFSNVDGFNIHGFNRWAYVYLNDEFPVVTPNTKKINTVFMDIEVDSSDGFPNPEDANSEVTAIAMRLRDVKIVLGLGEFKTTDKNVFYIQCKHEYHLLHKFVEIFETLNIDVLTGWNSEFFDIPYLVNRIRKIHDPNLVKRLSPWGIIQEKQVRDGFKKSTTYDIFGIACLDYLSVYRKFQLSPRESYKLDHIAFVELGEKKLDYAEYGNLHTLNRDNHQLFIEYNIHDTDLVFEIDKKLGYFEQIFSIAYSAKVNFVDALSSVLLWEVIIHNHLMNKNQVVPIEGEYKSDGRTIEGGYVKPPIVGMHKWVVSFDLNSLYPSIIQFANISPETLIRNKTDDQYLRLRDINVDTLVNKEIDLDFLQEQDLCVTANQQLYRKDKTGFLAELMAEMYTRRKDYKKRMIELEKKNDPSLAHDIEILNNLQGGYKTILNSAYGACANEYFRFFNLENAEAITKTGQLAVRWIERKLNEYLNDVLGTNEDYVVIIDTDSTYICLDKLVQKIFGEKQDRDKVVQFLDDVSHSKIEPFIEKSYHELFEYLNASSPTLVMKREAITTNIIACVHPDTMIYVNDEKIKISDYYNMRDMGFYNGVVDVYDKLDYTISFNDGVLLRDRINLITRKWYDGDMYEITQNGKTINVTSEHLILIKNRKTGIFDTWIRADELNENDILFELE